MSQDRTQDRTQTAGIRMEEGGMPAGQAPARQQPQRPMTATQKAIQDARNFQTRLLAEVTQQRPMIEGFLRVHGVDWDFFVAALKVGLEGTFKNDRDFFDPEKGVTVASFIDAVVRCSKDGLMPDGKQAAIARFLRVATYMPMVEGFCHILYATGFVKDINHDVVRDCDEIDAVQGDDGYVRQKKPFKRPAQAETIGAWCVINLSTGGKIIEVCDDKDLADIAKVSRSTKGPRVDWQDEMHRKGPFRRAMKRAPKDPRLAQLIAHDDMNYDLSRGTGERTIERTVVVPKDALFADKAVVKEKAKIAPPDPAEQIVEIEDDQPQVQGGQDVTADQVVTEIRHAETRAQVLSIREMASEYEFDGEELDWINEAVAARMQELPEDKPSDAEEGDSVLRAAIWSDRAPKAYENAMEWRDDILNKLSALTGPQAKAFVKVNMEFVRAAAEHHPDEAARVRSVFISRGLLKEEAE